MIKIEKQIAEDCITEWKEMSPDELNSVFRTFAPAELEGISYPEQFRRILGIKYGKIAKGLMGSIHDGKTVKMNLAIVDTLNNKGMPEKKVDIFFSVNDTDYYSRDIPNESGSTYGGFYAIDKAETILHSNPKYGISAEFKNQLANNLLICPLPIQDLVYSLAAPENNKTAPITAQTHRWTRAFYFLIDGNNKTILKNDSVVNEESIITIHFGVNPSDFVLDKKMLTLILEIKNPESSLQSTYFDFIGARPPIPPNI